VFRVQRFAKCPCPQSPSPCPNPNCPPCPLPPPCPSLRPHLTSPAHHLLLLLLLLLLLMDKTIWQTPVVSKLKVYFHGIINRPCFIIFFNKFNFFFRSWTTLQIARGDWQPHCEPGGGGGDGPQPPHLHCPDPSHPSQNSYSHSHSRTH
jgi:hypothetical protein